MKKIMAVLLALIMCLGLSALAEEENTAVETILAGPGMLAGGWQAAADPEVTEDLQAIFDKGLEGLVGVDYVPVVYLGSQVVAGTNHAFLCQAAVVVPNAVPQWAVVYLYEDLEGNVSILDIEDFDFGLLCDYGSDGEE